MKMTRSRSVDDGVRMYRSLLSRKSGRKSATHFCWNCSGARCDLIALQSDQKSVLYKKFRDGFTGQLIQTGSDQVLAATD